MGRQVSFAAGTNIQGGLWFSEDKVIIPFVSSTDGSDQALPDAVNIYAVKDGVWTTQAAITSRFGNIMNLLVSLMPLLLVIAFLANAWGALYNYASSTDGGIGKAVNMEVVVLVAMMVAVFLGPSFLEFAGLAASVNESGQYGNTLRFQNIARLLFELLPLGFTIGILGLTVTRGVTTLRQVRGRQSSEM